MSDENLLNKLRERNSLEHKSIEQEKIESLLDSFDCSKSLGCWSKKPGPTPEEMQEIKRKDIRRARAIEKDHTRLYRPAPHVIYIETLHMRNNTKIWEHGSFSARNRMDECGRISLTSEKRKG